MNPTDFRIANVIKHYRGLKHQDDAIAIWDEGIATEDQITREKLHKGINIWRSQPPVADTGVPQCGLELIKEFEGCELEAYPDPGTGGVPWTIGYGSTYKLNGSAWQPGDRITQEEADELLIQQAKNDFLPSLKQIPYWDEMNDNQRGALLSFAWNVGAAFYNSEGFNTISNILTNKNWFLIPEALMLYVNPGSNVEAGLRRRREAEGELWTKD